VRAVYLVLVQGPLPDLVVHFNQYLITQLLLLETAQLADGICFASWLLSFLL